MVHTSIRKRARRIRQRLNNHLVELMCRMNEFSVGCDTEPILYVKLTMLMRSARRLLGEIEAVSIEQKFPQITPPGNLDYLGNKS
jgi:hypothetical protein